jgi:pimeloyl-ACP methyl ester carboxylesterase
MAGADGETATLDHFIAEDGTRLAYRTLGTGRPVILIHGLFSNAQVNWIRYGHAAAIAARGFQAIMPDLRAHGDSAAPRDPTRYPPDILVDDAFTLIAHLALGNPDLAGYSLGGRTVARMLVRGARPRRAVIAGMGLDGLLDPHARAAFFRAVLEGIGTHPRGSPAFMAEAFLKTTSGDPAALLALLGSFVPTSRPEIAAITTPTLVCAGDQDADNGSAAALADALADGRYRAVPGNHMSAVTRPELGLAIADFLSG